MENRLNALEKSLKILAILGLLLFSACSPEHTPQATQPSNSPPPQPSALPSAAPSAANRPPAQLQANASIINQNAKLEACAIQVVGTGQINEISCSVIVKPERSQFQTESARQQAEVAWQAMEKGDCENSLTAFSQAMLAEPEDALISRIYLSQQINLARQCLAQELRIRALTPAAATPPRDTDFSHAALEMIVRGDAALKKGLCDVAKKTYQELAKVENRPWLINQLNDKIKAAEQCLPLNSDGPYLNTLPTAHLPTSDEPEPQPSLMPLPKGDYTNVLGMSFMQLQGGTFEMGQRHITPLARTVELSAFQMQTTEVTQKQWWEVMGSWPEAAPLRSVGAGDSYPMYYVSWCDIVGQAPDNDCPNEDSFLKRLNQMASGRYRLPTEAEWEYAARAGSSNHFACGSFIVALCPHHLAWYSENNGLTGSPAYGAKPVATRQANAWGLYDMHGNVWEWVQDRYAEYPEEPQTNPRGPLTGTSRVIRGGHWDSKLSSLYSASRNVEDPTQRSFTLGFRLVRLP